MRRTAVSIVAALALLAVLPGSSGARPVHPDAPFITSEPPMLVALQPGVAITPIINAGELIGGRLGGFQFTGVPDGIGLYAELGEPARGVREPRDGLSAGATRRSRASRTCH